MKTFTFYLNASNHFLNTPDYAELSKEEKDYNHFASILFSWVALESFINGVSESLAKGKRLNINEIAFLNEYEYRVNDDGNFNQINIRPSTTKKILFILNHFSRFNLKKFKQNKIWKDLKNFEDLRNRIIHHKEKNNLSINLKKATKCRDISKEAINYITKKIK